MSPPYVGRGSHNGIMVFFLCVFFFNVLFLNIFRISPGLPNVTDEFYDICIYRLLSCLGGFLVAQLTDKINTFQIRYNSMIKVHFYERHNFLPTTIYF